jgi:SAM-dependent methyltransferase
MSRRAISMFGRVASRLVRSTRVTERLYQLVRGDAKLRQHVGAWVEAACTQCGTGPNSEIYASQHGRYAPYYREAFEFLQKVLLRPCRNAQQTATMRQVYEECVQFTIERAPNLFIGPNPMRPQLPEFIEGLHRHYFKPAGSNAIHLELGTYTAFPDERVHAIVRAHGLGEFIRLDMNTCYKPDLAASCTALPLKDETIDRIDSNSLFEHVAYPHEIIREAFRVLRPGGVLYTTVPFHFAGHNCPSDYLRFTGQFFEDVCRDIGFELVLSDVMSSHGLYYTLHTASKMAVVWTHLDPVVDEAMKGLHLATVMLLSLMQPLDRFFMASSAQFHHSTIALAVKPGKFTPNPHLRDRSLPFLERNLDILCCPRTLEDLTLAGDRLIAVHSGHEYAVVNGIPDLVTFEGRWSPPVLKAENIELRREIDRLKAQLRGSARADAA